MAGKTINKLPVEPIVRGRNRSDQWRVNALRVPQVVVRGTQDTSSVKQTTETNYTKFDCIYQKAQVNIVQCFLTHEQEIFKSGRPHSTPPPPPNEKYKYISGQTLPAV